MARFTPTQQGSTTTTATTTVSTSSCATCTCANRSWYSTRWTKTLYHPNGRIRSVQTRRRPETGATSFCIQLKTLYGTWPQTLLKEGNTRMIFFFCLQTFVTCTFQLCIYSQRFQYFAYYACYPTVSFLCLCITILVRAK